MEIADRGLESIPVRHLDIGGGSGTNLEELQDKWLKNRLSYGDMQSIERLRASTVQDLMNLRGTRLAQKNPNMHVVIFDPLVPSVMYDRVHTELKQQVPNLDFVLGKVSDIDSKEQWIPFADGSFNSVDINFLFSPLTLKDFSRGKKEDMDTMQAYFSWMARPIANAEEIHTYLRALQEAGRVLKPGGFLKITEKRQRFERILAYLQKNSSFLDTLGLRIGDVASETDLNYSAYARAAQNSAKDWVERGQTDKAYQNEVLTLRLQKM